MVKPKWVKMFFTGKKFGVKVHPEIEDAFSIDFDADGVGDCFDWESLEGCITCKLDDLIQLHACIGKLLAKQEKANRAAARAHADGDARRCAEKWCR